MMIINNKFNIKDILYLKTDDVQQPRMVTAINIRNGYLVYELSCGSCTSWHCDFEISVEKNILLTEIDGN